jgi:DNA (cytosine-5)-methyltransferase 1
VSAYYNENDKFAAAWLRELIKAGLIADGEVDERSIEDVHPSDLAGFVQCHFFAGIGGWSYALRLAGWPDDRHVWTGSCPCQPWSVAGKGGGTEDPRDLWPAWYGLIRKLRPDRIFGEQVDSPDGRLWLDIVHDNLEHVRYVIGACGLPACSLRRAL